MKAVKSAPREYIARADVNEKWPSGCSVGRTQDACIIVDMRRCVVTPVQARKLAIAILGYIESEPYAFEAPR